MHQNAPKSTIAKKLKTLDNAGKISIFKGFAFGAEGGIRTLSKC